MTVITACGQDPLRTEEQEFVWTYTDTLTVAHWNIGHFALGRADNTTIPGEQSESAARQYHTMLDTLGVDVIGLCEYNSFFDLSGGSTRDLLFREFPFFEMGDKLSYNFNVIFSKIILYNPKTVFFDNHVQARYYIETTLKINDHDVKFIETHLDWDEGADGADCRKEQIRHLAETYGDEPYVIICADFNTNETAELFPFTEAGFTLADSGNLPSYPATNPQKPIDNIIVRGFTIETPEMITDAYLSDHSLIRTKLVFKE